MNNQFNSKNLLTNKMIEEIIKNKAKKIAKIIFENNLILKDGVDSIKNYYLRKLKTKQIKNRFLFKQIKEFCNQKFILEIMELPLPNKLKDLFKENLKNQTNLKRPSLCTYRKSLISNIEVTTKEFIQQPLTTTEGLKFFSESVLFTCGGFDNITKINLENQELIINVYDISKINYENSCLPIFYGFCISDWLNADTEVIQNINNKINITKIHVCGFGIWGGYSQIEDENDSNKIIISLRSDDPDLNKEYLKYLEKVIQDLKKQKSLENLSLNEIEKAIRNNYHFEQLPGVLTNIENDSELRFLNQNLIDILTNLKDIASIKNIIKTEFAENYYILKIKNENRNLNFKHLFWHYLMDSIVQLINNYYIEKIQQQLESQFFGSDNLNVENQQTIEINKNDPMNEMLDKYNAEQNKNK